MPFLRLLVRNLTVHPLRALLTVGSLVVALFLLCTLRSLITTLESSVQAASTRRVVVQSAVSLFVTLPLHYEQRIAQLPGIERVSKWHWFGAYYREERNQFSQFAVDPDEIFAIYPEFDLVEGSAEAFADNRRGCVVGEGLAEQFGWRIGDNVPLIGMIYPHPDGPDTAWEFEVEAIYRPTQKNFDRNGMLFQWEYFEQTMEGGTGMVPGVGTYVVQVEQGTDPTSVMAVIDALYENGPQRVQATSEAEFQKQFISMMGNIPFFLTSIGGAVLAAILLACVNTLLMAVREQTHDIGVMKALGFTDGRMFALLIGQAFLLCGVGGGLGVLLAKVAEPGIAEGMGSFFPGYAVQPSTVALGLSITFGLALLAGGVPAWRANRLRPVEALRRGK